MSDSRITNRVKCSLRYHSVAILCALVPCLRDFWVLPLFTSSFTFSCLLSLSPVPDIDECSTLAQPCSPGFNCINTAGSYMCQRKMMCSRGYHASPNGSSCIGKNCFSLHFKKGGLSFCSRTALNNIFIYSVMIEMI